MSTLRKNRKRIREATAGLLLLIPILVIALAVKSSTAFEGKSDTLRQALRQEQLVAAAKCNEFLPRELARKEIYVSPALISRKDVEIPEIMEDIFVQTTAWIVKNEKENVIVAIVIPPRIGETDKNPVAPEERFSPPGCVILYKKK